MPSGKKKKKEEEQLAGDRPIRERDILVDPASIHMLVSKIKPCMSKFTPFVR